MTDSKPQWWRVFWHKVMLLLAPPNEKKPRYVSLGCDERGPYGRRPDGTKERL